MTSLKIRKAKEDDTEKLATLFLITRQKTFKSAPPQKFKMGDYKESVVAEEVWIAEEDGDIVGFVSLWRPDNFIHNLFVHPDWQNQGIGQKLLKKAEKRLSFPMELKVTTDNIKAQKFYQKHGWEKVALRDDVPEPYFLFKKY